VSCAFNVAIGDVIRSSGHAAYTNMRPSERCPSAHVTETAISCTISCTLIADRFASVYTGNRRRIFTAFRPTSLNAIYFVDRFGPSTAGSERLPWQRRLAAVPLHGCKPSAVAAAAARSRGHRDLVAAARGCDARGTEAAAAAAALVRISSFPRNQSEPAEKPPGNHARSSLSLYRAPVNLPAASPRRLLQLLRRRRRRRRLRPRHRWWRRRKENVEETGARQWERKRRLFRDEGGRKMPANESFQTAS